MSIPSLSINRSFVEEQFVEHFELEQQTEFDCNNLLVNNRVGFPDLSAFPNNQTINADRAILTEGLFPITMSVKDNEEAGLGFNFYYNSAGSGQRIDTSKPGWMFQTDFLNLFFNRCYINYYKPTGGTNVFILYCEPNKIIMAANRSKPQLLNVGTGKFVRATSYTPFTGVHFGGTDLEYPPGTILESKGDYCLEPTVMDAWIDVQQTTTSDSKKVVGVYVKPVDADAGYDISLCEYVGCGECQLRVCGENGDIQVGDYLTSSSIPGVAMRQTDSRQLSSTIAKASVNHTFNIITDEALVGCFVVL